MGQILVQKLRKAFSDRPLTLPTISNGSTAPNHTALVLDDINLKINQGELVCLLGPSGCGKSTLLRILAGFDLSIDGTVLIDGHPVRGPRANHIFVFQQSALLPWLTVWQNVELGLRNIPNESQKQAKIQEFIDMVELEGFESHFPHQISGGMQRRAELARALAVNPDILFMDEPFTGLDFFARMKLREEIINMHSFFGKTIIFVTHDIDDAMIMGDRIVVLAGRPARVRLEQRLEFPRPRDFENCPDLSKLRAEVYFMLGVPYAV